MLAHDDVRAWYGWAELSPGDPIVAGSLGRWQLTYHVGRYGIAAGGSLKLVFRAASDWPVLQGKDPYEESFLTVTTTGHALLAWRYEPRGYVYPWPKAVTVDVARAPLVEDDTVLFFLGDPEGGSPGVRAQTFCERRHEFRLVVDPFGGGEYVPVPSPAVEIVAGPAARLALVAPSRVAPGEGFALTVRLEDRWGNPARGYVGRVDLDGLPGAGGVDLAEAGGGVARVRLVAPTQAGLLRLRAREGRLRLAAESNPVQVQAPGDRSLLPLWGDLHGQSAETGGTNPARECFLYARDVAALDFCSLQGDDHLVTAAFWHELQETVRAFNEPGRFVAYLGYRWAGNTAGGGAHSVLFPGDSASLYRCRVPGAGGAEEPVCFPLCSLHEALRGQDALLIASTGSPLASLEHHDADLTPLVEVYSAWGEAPWLLDEALQRSLVVGFVAGGANVTGRPGAGDPGAGDMVSRGGLTCVYAAARTRQAVWQALRARRCYATTGARILLDVHADGQPMGALYRTSRPPTLQVQVAGTAEIERVEIRRGAEVAYRYPERDVARPGRVRVVWGGAMARDWPRHVPWDGTLRVHGARIRAVMPYRFDSAARGILLANEQSVSWRSLTAGNENGLLLDLEAPAGGRLEFYSPLGTLAADLAELPRALDLGGEGLHVRAEPWPQGTGSRDLHLTWAEEELPLATTPYQVTVYQVDGAKAWSSPIYVQAPSEATPSRQGPVGAYP